MRLRVPRHDLKRVKTVLETSRIFKAPLHFEHDTSGPTSIVTAFFDGSLSNYEVSQVIRDNVNVHEELGTVNLAHEVEILELFRAADDSGWFEHVNGLQSSSHASTIKSVTKSWLQSLEVDGTLKPSDATDLLASANTGRYQVYKPMLLFSAGAFESVVWRALLDKLPFITCSQLFRNIAREMNVTHVAVNAPIPRSTNTGVHTKASEENTVRSPSGLNVLYGNFGPFVESPPTARDLESAFWVTVIQNGITQTWAPRYTMFSRGNITEKTRVLKLPTVLGAVANAQTTGTRCTAIDLYAGIGYFAFSYVKAGIDKVLCFEINPWSVEGLRRGAEANQWAVDVVNEESMSNSIVEAALQRPEVRLLAFEMSNEHALPIVERLNNALPPVRHVNCGLLPSSKQSWAIAVQVVDRQQGGWLHIHENISIADIENSAAAILEAIAVLVRDHRPASQAPPVLEHVQRVKTYSRGVMHCVLDIYVPPVES